jgi:hypothetical protein
LPRKFKSFGDVGKYDEQSIQSPALCSNAGVALFVFLVIGCGVVLQPVETDRQQGSETARQV